MKIFVKSIFVLLIFHTFAFATCDVKAKFGEKKDVFEKKEIAGRAFPAEYPGLEIYPILANDICPNEKLDDIAIEYRFLNDELVAINFVALNDDRNIPSEKLTLMNYVKKTYGDFDTTNNPKAYNDFHVFEKSNLFVVYQRLPGDDGIMNEQMYLSTPEFDKKLGQFYADKEMEMLENSQ